MSRDTTFPVGSRAETAPDACAEFVIDEQTFRAFYERTARALWSYLSRVTGDRQLADDLLQETYYRFLRANAVHETEQHRRNSLYQIATNLARDARRRGAVRAGSLLAGDDIEHATAGDPTGATERAADLSAAMQHLAPRERAMLWLAYAEGASHREIASVLGLSPSSLKPLLFRARRRLAALLRGPQERSRP